MTPARLHAVLLRAIGVLLVGCALPAAAEAPGAPAPTPGAEQASSAPPDAAAPGTPEDPRPSEIRSLCAGSLDVRVLPQTLFNVALDDEDALQVEAVRVSVLLRVLDEATHSPAASQHAAVRKSKDEPSSSLDSKLWSERLDLDRARLEFYELPLDRRDELLREHTARQEAARPQESEEQRRTRQAEDERARALEAARVARSEAERVVSEELARLIALETRVRQARHDFQVEGKALARRRDEVLGWQRQVRDAKAAGPMEADASYDALRRALRTTRDDLSLALVTLREETTNLPSLGADPLVDVPADVPLKAARSRRGEVQRAITAARRDEQALREEQAATLLDQVDMLNHERLGLLPSLSQTKRDAITGFTSMGWDQARSEARHLSLILRYHEYVGAAWIRAVRSGASAGISRWQSIVVLTPLVLVVAAFFWARSRTQALLRWYEMRLARADHADRRISASLGRRAIRILLEVHLPLEWILFGSCLFWLLPSGARGLLEVQMVSWVVGWALVGAVVVNVINALASGNTATLASVDEGAPGKLRLRSLKLVGRTILAFALILVLSSRLVGEGTIYSWVFSTCWFAAIPVFLVLVRWWRGTVFERLERLRKKSPLQTWILANLTGWKSFAAAMVGAVQLFTTGTVRLVRNWLSDFDLARRVHAYWYKREIERIGEGHAHQPLVSLSVEALDALNPERPVARWLPCPSDAIRTDLIDRAVPRRGGLIVLVASRGMGKSSLLQSVADQVPATSLIRCNARTTVSDFMHIDVSAPLVLLDDAQLLIEPRIGGLARFDEVMALARTRSVDATWVFAVDSSIWPLLKRARDAGPLFDEVRVLPAWNEEQLGALISERCEIAQITPRYDDLIDKLPPSADEIDRQDAVDAKRAGYERMLWDHVSGNPGLALQAWRLSLGQDEAGLVHVRPLQVPDMTRLERLPDSSLFVLRAVLQLAPTTPESIAQATRLSPEEVMRDFQFGRAQGLYEEHQGQFRVAWPWLRASTRLLERRHLLRNS